jgi:hypothetical protein
VATFIPKAHTPFQWVALQDAAQIAEKQNALRRALPGRGVRLSWSDEPTTWLEAALSRGDRRLGRVILRAWELGARFDAWTEAYKPELWERAFAEADLDPKFYASRQRSHAEVLPWGHIDTGVDQSCLWQEYQRALQGESSINCAEGCTDCGVRVAFDLAHCPPAADAR